MRIEAVVVELRMSVGGGGGGMLMAEPETRMMRLVRVASQRQRDRKVIIAVLDWHVNEIGSDIRDV